MILKKLDSFWNNWMHYLLPLAFIIFTQNISTGYGRLMLNWPITVLLILFTLFRFTKFHSTIQKVLAKIPAKDIVSPISAAALVLAILAVSFTGPLASQVTSQYFKPLLLFFAFFLVLSVFLSDLSSKTTKVFSFFPVLIALAIGVIANKLFNVYGLLVLTALTGIFLLIKAFFDDFLNVASKNSNLLFILIPIMVLWIDRGIIQILIRKFFLSGIILNHNYTSIGLVLGFFLPFYLKDTLISKKWWAILIFVPAVLSYLFYGEVAVVYLLVLTYATLVISYLNLKEALPLNLLALGTVLFTYFNRSFLLDHAPLDFLLRVGGFAVLVALGLVFYIFRKKLLKIVD